MKQEDLHTYMIKQRLEMGKVEDVKDLVKVCIDLCTVIQACESKIDSMQVRHINND